MSWKEHIHTDPEILFGKPVIKGTRISVEFLLGLYKAGWSEKDILENYPHITNNDLRALEDYSDIMTAESRRGDTSISWEDIKQKLS